MSWILWIVVGLAGLFLLGALYGLLLATGILSEFLIFLLFLGGGAAIGAFFDAPQIGCVVGGVIYLLRCIYHIVSPKESTLIEGWSDGSTTTKKLSTADKGWAGIAMLIIVAVILGIMAMCS